MHRTRFPGLTDGWARLDGAAGTQMVDDAIEEMAAWMRSGHAANHGGAFQAAERTDALVAEARASVARLLGAGAEGVVFGPSMTALTMRFSAAVVPLAAARRRDRLHAPGPRRQRRAVAHRRRARRRRGALRRARPRDPRAARRRRRGRALASARAGSRSPPPPTRSARSPTCPASSTPPTAPARASSSTPCTPPRTARSTSPRWAATRWRARPTSGSGRTSGSCGRAPSCWATCRPTSCAPRRTRCPTAGSWGRCPSSR